MARRKSPIKELADHLTDWLRHEIEASGGAGAVFGLSGGIDSAVVAALAKRAFPHHTLGVLMPCHSDPADAEDATLVGHHFAVPTATVVLDATFDTLVEELGRSSSDLPETRAVTANIKPRLRMATLYAFASLLNYRVLASSNLDELTVGYFTKFGDGGADLMPLGELTKADVRALALELGVPQRVIAKTPSAGLWSGQTDEGEMGFTYAQLDAYVSGEDVPAEVRERIEALKSGSAHKRALPKVAPRRKGK